MITSTSPQRPDDIVVRVAATEPAAVRAAAEAARKAQPDWVDAGAAGRRPGARPGGRRRAGCRRRTGSARGARGRQAAGRGPGRDRAVGVDPALLRPAAVRPRSAPCTTRPARACCSPPGGHAGWPGSSRRGTSRSRSRCGRPLPRWPTATPCCSNPPSRPPPARCGCTSCSPRCLPAGLFSRRCRRGGHRPGRRRGGRRGVLHRLHRGGPHDRRRRGSARHRRCRPRWAGRTRRSSCPTPMSRPPPRSIAAAVAGYAGQKCTATKRVIVVGDAARFTDALVEAVRALVVGDPAREDVAVGPVIDSAARDRVLAAAASVEAAGGRVLTGATAIGDAGWFVEPTVVDGLPAGPPAGVRGGVRPDLLDQQRRNPRPGDQPRQRRAARAGGRALHPRHRRRPRCGRAAGRRHDQGQRADHRGRLLPALRRREGVRLRPEGAGQGRGRALHQRPHRHRRSRAERGDRFPGEQRGASEHAWCCSPPAPGPACATRPSRPCRPRSSPASCGRTWCTRPRRWRPSWACRPPRCARPSSTWSRRAWWRPSATRDSGSSNWPPPNWTNSPSCGCCWRCRRCAPWPGAGCPPASTGR